MKRIKQYLKYENPCGLDILSIPNLFEISFKKLKIVAYSGQYPREGRGRCIFSILHVISPLEDFEPPHPLVLAVGPDIVILILIITKTLSIPVYHSIFLHLKKCNT